ncbi:MAG: hypothetical protein IJU78_01300 [Clostridia bacterium]|nr:hypothetical protein [Clostridia bacterium]
MNTDFEKAFGDFIDRREYDQAENALFSMVRIAFIAGWNAAGGAPLKPQANAAPVAAPDELPKNGIATDIDIIDIPQK